MPEDVFDKFDISLADHLNAFVKGIYLSLPDGVSSQCLKQDLCARYKAVFGEIITYDPYHGVALMESTDSGGRRQNKQAPQTRQVDFLTLLDQIANRTARTEKRFLVLLDGVDSYLNEELVMLKLSEILNQVSFGYSLVFLGFKEFSRFNPLPRLNISEIPYPAPCSLSLRRLVRSGLEAISMESEDSLDLDSVEGRFADSLLGCPSLAVAEDILNLSYSVDGNFSPASVERLKLARFMTESQGITIRSPLELPSMDQVASLDRLKEYCTARKNVFLGKVEEPTAIALHGICLVGPPGTGKTLFARALANAWEVPYCSLSMTFLSRFFGSSERNLERILRLLTDFGRPILLHLDELSRILGRNNAEDHEVTKRLLAMLLDFMESPDSRNVYVVGTTNHLALEPALMRRFDDVFYVGLPDSRARKELFEQFFRKYEMSCPLDDTALPYSQGMAGSEIERTIKDLKIESLSKGTQPSIFSLIQCLKKRPPVASLFKEISQMEELAVRAGFRLAASSDHSP
ncbi:MAG: ATP-binding protein [Deltaproteobacteria bacterium]|nr:MAG: ATP-binding protein [Deltaproteobacteria bacterium]